MINKLSKALTVVCFVSVVLFGIQGISAEAAEHKQEETKAIKSQEWLQNTESPEGYELGTVQELDNGIIAVTYTKEDSGNDAEPRTSTIVKTQLIYFYLYNGSANPPLLAEYLETSKWAYGGSVGTTPYFSSASYEIRYVNSDYGVTAWGTPQMINRHSSSNGTVTYNVEVELTVNGVTSTYTSGTYTLKFS